MIYQINNGLVKYASDTILDHINFEIRNTEKIAVVGRNGCGKTTLFKLIAGLLPLDNLDSDENSWISKAGNTTIGFLQQISFENENITAEEELLKAFATLLEWKVKLEQLCIQMESNQSKEVLENYSKTLELFENLGGYSYQSEMETIVTRFGFALTDLKRPIKNFSGGQRTKLAFIRLLLNKPDVLLLDEPTNHLDLPTIEWLERYLKQYPKAVVIISHDRMFLDKIADVTYEIEHRKMTRYQGNYSAFVKQKRLNWDKQQKDYQLQQKEITRLMALIEKYKHHPTKVAMTKSKLKQIEHMDLARAPERYDLKSFHAEFKPLRAGGQEVLKVNRLVIGYDKPLCEVSFELKKGQRLAVIGENGIGKSTLLKTLVRQVNQMAGTFSYGFQIDPGYFDQQLAQNENDTTVLEDFCEEFPDMLLSEARSALGCFLFTQDTVYKKVCQLSGGEKVRLSLAKILKKRPNLLILDEPTNHMDIVSKEALEAMLMNYEGTVLFVSHDRYFVQKIADSLLVFETDKVNYYPFGYQEYTERELSSDEAKASIKFLSQTNAPKAILNGKERDRKALDRKKQAMRKIEIMVEDTEREIERIKALMESPEIACDYAKLTEINDQLIREENKLEVHLENYLKEKIDEID
jgi:ATP-binding cassette, subfamily F, member 3